VAPAAAVVGNSVVGTLLNCSNGETPWGTYLSCEETDRNGIDPAQASRGYGWVVEIDPQGQLAPPTKRTALGRFAHEAVAFLADSNNRTAFYMTNDASPGCIYKFVPSSAFSSTNRSQNADLLDNGVLYVARFNGDGSGEWRELVLGRNGLAIGATDPGNASQGPATPTIVNFATQADILVSTASAARVAGGTGMDRPEGIAVSREGEILCALTNNSGRISADPANPRAQNLHGHIVKLAESGNSPLATSFRWEIFLLAGDPSLATAQGNLTGNVTGDTFSSPDNIRVDPQGRIWVETDHRLGGNAGAGSSTYLDVFGNNAMFNIDPATKRVSRFLVGPAGSEITGLAYTPDLTTFFVNIQHPSGAWPEAGRAPRSSLIAIYRPDGRPVGA
jgi:uncharacterized protein